MLKRILIFVLFVGIMGCASANTPKETSKDIPPEKTTQNIPPSSKFSKVKVEMGVKQVVDLIGQPTEIDTRRTMKEMIPFYYGRDFVHTIYIYKGEGRIEFNSDLRVEEIQYNPSESGYK